MKGFQARVYTNDPEAVALRFGERGLIMGPGVRLGLTSIIEEPGMLGPGLIVSVGVSFEKDADPCVTAAFIYDHLVGESDAALVVYDQGACSARDVEELLLQHGHD